jgi:deazaflavin-dependent oxidoreductase (nitroreductase family)
VPIPKAIARFNRRVTNPLVGRLAGWLPPLAIVVHRGRRSGREYRTPIMAFPRRGGVVIALTYGPDVDWVRNVVAAGRCRLIYRGREVSLARPRLVEMVEPPSMLPALVRVVLRLARVDHYLLAPEPMAASMPSASQSSAGTVNRLRGPGLHPK